MRRWTRPSTKASWWCRTSSRACGFVVTWAPRSTASCCRGRSRRTSGRFQMRWRTSTGRRPGLARRR
uniref:Tetratricopeptide repeat and ankyrin repeat containing 1 n=1 Tax=Myotis myotis TaxID=51298 RepID=A0A7J7UEW7_MYOMY|nr:tetratricopeptide repeat and ankyrin repeat containing 1 [Myotis myotis]